MSVGFILTDVYYDVKPPHGYEAQACTCKMPEEKDKLGCGDDCINRVVYAECSPDLCPLKEKCSNQKIQKHSGDMKLIKFKTKDKVMDKKQLNLFVLVETKKSVTVVIFIGKMHVVLLRDSFKC